MARAGLLLPAPAGDVFLTAEFCRTLSAT